ncbi:MAG: hypothetical protein V2A73_03325 [Pseudomonadota bacterium]
MTTKLGLVASTGILLSVVAGCEKPTHASIDKWRGTVKGPSKLLATVVDSSLEADLRGHALQALVSVDKSKEALDVLKGLSQQDRAAILDNATDRLWDDCKLAEELQVPTSKQLAAKDALFLFREAADDPVRDKMDARLLDWLVGYYEERAKQGLFRGEVIVRTLGVKAAPKLLEATQAIVDASTKSATTIPVAGDELLKSLAFSGAPEAISLILKLAEKQHADPTLQVRAMGALYYAYVQTTDEPVTNRGVLIQFMPQLLTMASAPAPYPQPGENVNVAVALIAAAGKPHCLAPLASLAAHHEEVRRWQAVQQGLKCAGVDGVAPMAEALPQNLSYPRAIAEKYFWDKIVDLGSGAAEPARALLKSQGWFARVTGVAVLARLGSRSDVAALRAIKGDGRRARGYWKEDPASKRKPEPTVGALAIEVAGVLERKE